MGFKFFFFIGVLLVSTVCALAQPPGNIALGRPYTFDPIPDYALCTDAGDRSQLTDGVYTEGYFWTQASTVGWNIARPAIITIDLGRVEAIRGVAYSSAAGVAGVEWPGSIGLFVSDDGKRFHEAGDLIVLSRASEMPPQNGYATYRFKTEGLRTHGRYVSLVVSSPSYSFVDEIEVYRGDPVWLGEPFSGQTASDVKAYYKATEVRRCVQRRLLDDIASLRPRLANSRLPAKRKEQISAKLDAAEQEAGRLPRLSDPRFRAVLPLSPLHQRILRVQAALWRSEGSAPLTAWSDGLWEPLSHIRKIPYPSKPSVQVAMMSGEYRAGAFNISNASDQPITLRLRIVGLPGGPNPPYITIHQAEWTDTRSGVPVAAALPPARRAGQDYVIRVPSGLTRQVWLTFHPVSARPGKHRGLIRLVSGKARMTVPVALHLYPMRFPERPTLHLGGWDYTDLDAVYDITRRNRSLVLAHLRERFVDTPWATAAVLPPGRYDASGRMIAPPDTAPLDRWLRRWPQARQYRVFAAVGDRFDGSPMDTPEFARKVGHWIRFWEIALRKRGIAPSRLALLLVDEPTEAKQDAVIRAWAKAILAARTGIRIWEDPTHADPYAANPEMIAACDILCPNRVMFLSSGDRYRAFFARLPQEKAFYSCSGPVRLLDPYTYHRLQAWSCWRQKAKSSYFWAFSDSGGGSSWNEYAARGAAFVPFFLDSASVTPGKHMEAIREGVEDYEYLVMLRQAVDQAGKKERRSPALERARKLLREAPGRVLNAKGIDIFEWHRPKDRSLADRVRIEILEALSGLRK
ncbi:MAG: hypothetical protein IT210_25725 [Armatimonadetes bacterium]|nr:hypothetical protein [Armatimonadota bacterium]